MPCAGGFEEALGVAFAPHWNASYVQDKTAVWRKPGPRNVPVALALIVLQVFHRIALVPPRSLNCMFAPPQWGATASDDCS